MDKALTKLRSTFGIAEAQGTSGTGFWESLDESTTLSRTNRFYGFVISAGLGFLFCFIAMLFIMIGPGRFAVLYTLGILCFLMSTFFLMGPWNQIKNMMTMQRLPASIAFVACIGLTFWAAFSVESVVLVIIFFVLQMIALAWYVLTYIPYGQQAASSFLTSMFS